MVQDTERHRIAKDLHDGIGSLLSTAKIYTEKAERSPLLDKAIHIIDVASNEVRRIAHNMMPSALQKLGLIQAVGELITEYDEQSAVEYTYYHMIDGTALPAEKEISIYRIIQELLTNVHRHAEACKVHVQIDRHDGHIHITVEDDGVGMPSDDRSKRTGVGLQSISSRVAYLEGRMTIDSEPSSGTSIEVVVPV